MTLKISSSKELQEKYSKPKEQIGDFDIQNGMLIKYNGKGKSTVVIPEGVIAIGENAITFSDVMNIVIPNSVTTIGESAFRTNFNLREIIIPSSVGTIGKDAFFECFGLETVLIEEGVKEIGAGAFTYCSGLEQIFIPKSVSSIPTMAFFLEFAEDLSFIEPDVTIYSPKGSYAEQYAKNKGFDYVACEYSEEFKEHFKKSGYFG